jgi:hypothetical protein
MKHRNSFSTFAITLDTDWAPDWMLEEVISILIEKDVKSTWFVTNDSSVLNLIRRESRLFEIGIHPNCLPGSSHGKTEDEVLNHMRQIVPHAISMRTHGLYQSSSFLRLAARRYEIKIDVSLLLPGTQHIEPHILHFGDAKLLRIPFFGEDDLEMLSRNPAWRLSNPKYYCSGLKIFNFHPVHIVLNSPTMDLYNTLKSSRSLSQWTPEFVRSHRWSGEGTRSLFMDLVHCLKGSGKLIREWSEGIEGL